MYCELMATAKSIPLSKRPISDDSASDLASVFAALADPVRLRLFDLVRRAGTTGVCSCDLVEPLERSQPTISHHLKVLREAGLVESRREGTWLWYSVVADALKDTEAFIAHSTK
jgi:ArsR family transcriptional regulator, arsenate/arsenite/antimonite-responsive transcriptional repressor